MKPTQSRAKRAARPSSIARAMLEASRALTELDPEANHHDAVVIDNALQALKPGARYGDLPGLLKSHASLVGALKGLADQAAECAEDVEEAGFPHRRDALDKAVEAARAELAKLTA